MRFVTRRKPSTILLAAAAAAAAAVAVPASASAAAGTSPVVGHVYVNDNTAGANTIAVFDRHADGTLTPMPDPRSPLAAPEPGRDWPLRVRCRSPRTAGSCLPSMPAATRSRCCGSSPAGRSSWCPAGSSPPVVCCRSASLSTATWCMWPTPAPAAATTPASGSAATAGCARSPALRSPCPTAPSQATCCSTPPAVSWPAPASEPPRSTASPSRHGRLTAAPRSPFPAQGLGPFGSEFRPGQPPSAVRVQRPQHRHRQRHGLGVPRLRQWDAHLGRLTRRSPTTRPPRAGWRSPTTAGSCSP